MDRVFSFHLPSYLSGGFRSSDFSLEGIGTSDCNTYIPAYSIYGNELHTFINKDDENDKLEILEYSIPNISNSGTRRYNDLISALRLGCIPNKFYYKLGNVQYGVNMFRGILYTDEYEVLMCLGINSKYVMNTDIQDIINSPDISQFALFISKRFNENPIYKNLRKKLEIEYVNPIKEEGIDVIETSRLTSWLFKNNFKPPKFKSVIEMNNHLKNEIPKLVMESV